jgi:hypothetical protein
MINMFVKFQHSRTIQDAKIDFEGKLVFLTGDFKDWIFFDGKYLLE